MPFLLPILSIIGCIDLGYPHQPDACSCLFDSTIFSPRLRHKLLMSK
jgi:hypothetical protein